ncbi:MAG: nucleotidyltransferase family protein [Pseudomonadota bacterium]
MTDAPDAIMVFAAGFGTRMGALTADRPKPLIEVAGKPLIEHALERVAQAGISRTVVNAHYRAGQMADYLADRPVTLSVEAPDILDTGGGLRQAMPLLGPGQSVYTMNSDAVWRGSNPLVALRDAWAPATMDALLLVVPAERAGGRGDRPGDFLVGEDGRLTRGGPFVYTGAQLLKSSALDKITNRVFSLNRVWDQLFDKGRLFGAVWDGSWVDVGSPRGVDEAEALLGYQRP